MERMGAGYATARGDQRSRSDDSGRLRIQALDNPLLPLRPTTVNEALDLGFQLLRSRVGLLVGLVATFYLPIQILDLTLRLTVATQAERANSAAVVFGVAGVGEWSGWMFLPFGLQRVALSMLGVSCGFLAMAMIRGETPSYRTVLAFTLKRCWMAVVIVVAVAALMVFGTFLAMLGAVLFGSWTFVASVIAGAEQRGPLSSVGRSISLSRANGGQSLMMFVGIIVVTVLVRTITYAGPALLLTYLGMPEGLQLLVGQLSALLLLIAPLLTACLATTSYLSMRTRSEGLDLQLRMGNAVGARNVGAVDVGP
ncbi:MAG: hypothetical protein WBA45_15770 [Microthrixaceae bacterium]